MGDISCQCDSYVNDELNFLLIRFQMKTNLHHRSCAELQHTRNRQSTSKIS